MRSVRRVVVLGSSISCLVRPSGQGLPYPAVLENLLNQDDSELWLVENLSEVAGTAEQMLPKLAHLVNIQPDVIILHYGHVEAIRRPHSRRMWLWTHLYRPGANPVSRQIRIYWGLLYASARRQLGWTRQWVRLPRFKRILNECLGYLRRETSAELFLIQANPWNGSIETYGPGSYGEIEKYNDAMRECAKRYSADFVSIQELTGEEPFRCTLDQLIPDGTHFSAEAHSLLAELLLHRIMAVSRRRSDGVAREQQVNGQKIDVAKGYLLPSSLKKSDT